MAWSRSISRILLRHGLGDVAERLFGRSRGSARTESDEDLVFRSTFPSPRRIRLVLEELGPSFVKLGQLMSTRADLFPAEHIEELKKLQDRVPPIPFEDVKSVIEGELGKPLDAVFAEFAEECLAAASVTSASCTAWPSEWRTLSSWGGCWGR